MRKIIVLTEKAKTALRKSIKKWEGVVLGTIEEKGSSNCALCQAYAHCAGCPVAMDTGRNHCDGTPYMDWDEATFKLEEETLYDWRTPFRRWAVTPAQMKAAIAEVNYLSDLLERGSK